MYCNMDRMGRELEETLSQIYDVVYRRFGQAAVQAVGGLSEEESGPHREDD